MSYRPVGQPGTFAESQGFEAQEAFSLVDRHTTVEGTLTSNRDVRIEGEMRGTIRCQGLLHIAEGADVDATVEAASVTVAGRLRGNVTCRGRFQIMPTGRVLATVTTESLVINEGAIFEGELQMGAGIASSASGVTGQRHEGDQPVVMRQFTPEGTDDERESDVVGRRTTEE